MHYAEPTDTFSDRHLHVVAVYCRQGPVSQTALSCAVLNTDQQRPEAKLNVKNNNKCSLFN